MNIPTSFSKSWISNNICGQKKQVALKQNLLLFFVFILFICEVSLKEVFPHIIWMYYDKGYQQMSRFQKLCVQRVKTLHQQTDWKVKLLNQQNLKNWLTLQSYQELQQILNLKLMAVQSKSDFIRYFLLRQHGGVWIDVSIILYQNLNWLDNLKQNSYVLHKNVFQSPQIFIFSSYSQKSIGQKVIIQINNSNIHPIISFENSFIAAIPESNFIKDLINEMKILLKEGRKRYYLMKNQYSFQYEYNQYYRAYIATNIVLYKRYDELMALTAKNNLKIEETATQKLYKIMFINKNRALYHIEEGQQYYRYFLEPEGRPYGNYGMFMRKFNHFRQVRILQAVLDNNRSLLVQEISKFKKTAYYFWNLFFSENYRCLQFFVIRQDSVINKYLILNNFTLAQNLFPNLFVSKQENIPFICKITNLIQLGIILPVLLHWSSYTLLIFLIIQFSVEFLFFSLKGFRFFFVKSKDQTKRYIWRKFLILLVLYQEKKLIYNQYTLWAMDSPKSFLSLFFLLILALFFLNLLFELNFFRLPLKLLEQKFFEVYFLFIIGMQYLLEYYTTIWRYSGQIFNYSQIQLLNLETIQNSQICLIKITFLIILHQILITLANIFNLKFKQSKVRYKNKKIDIKKQIQMQQTIDFQNQDCWKNSQYQRIRQI